MSPSTDRRQDLWVVEIMFSDSKGDGWQPTVGVSLSRSDGRACLGDWKQRNPDDFFRLKKYRRYE
jgi:hypothetical protein